MTDKTKEIKEKLNTARVNSTTLNKIVKDRIDFGFDSIYFRYAEVCDELAVYKAKLHGSDPIKERNYVNGRKQHFYEALEQLLMAHEKEGENSDTYE